ncbi:hypothetical protein ONZ45_g15339 [Pleurotus djamor]|nr:hypothetical protein ONZ45_g15339 [Pleurotus djamor]
MGDTYDWPRKIFSRQLLPYLLKIDQRDAHSRKDELLQFWEAAFEVIFDRFPPPKEPSYAATMIKKYIKNDAVLYLSMAQRGGVAISPQDWRPKLNLEADRAERRRWWKRNGEGPLKEHQFITAFQGIERKQK